MNKLRALALLLIPVALCAQRDPITRVYEMKTSDDVRAASIRQLVQEVVGVRVMLSWLPPLRTIVLRGPNTADVDDALALLEKYDVPARQVEFTAYIVQAMKKIPGFFVRDGVQMKPAPGDIPPPLPAVLTPVVEEMKQTFGYQSFELMDKVETRTSYHAGFSSGLGTSNASYEINYDGVSVSNDGKVVSVPRFNFRLLGRAGRGGGQTESSSEIQNEVTLHGDERLVVGKLRLPNSTGDIFVVLTAKPL